MLLFRWQECIQSRRDHENVAIACGGAAHGAIDANPIAARAPPLQIKNLNTFNNPRKPIQLRSRNAEPFRHTDKK
jgi:hypothetical protein